MINIIKKSFIIFFIFLNYYSIYCNDFFSKQSSRNIVNILHSLSILKKKILLKTTKTNEIDYQVIFKKKLKKINDYFDDQEKTWSIGNFFEIIHLVVLIKNLLHYDQSDFLQSFSDGWFIRSLYLDEKNFYELDITCLSKRIAKTFWSIFELNEYLNQTAFLFLSKILKIISNNQQILTYIKSKDISCIFLSLAHLNFAFHANEYVFTQVLEKNGHYRFQVFA